MQQIIPPVSKELLLSELNSSTFLRKTNKGNNEVYLFNIHNAPNAVREVGRLREVTFRAAGGGTGLSIDLDENDTCENCYDQLVVWNPTEQEIVAGYRLIKCAEAGFRANGEMNLSMAHLFEFNQNFMQHYIPTTLELGRSFVIPKYQPSVNNRLGLFSLDNLWDGLGAVVVLNPDINYLFGKVTMYTHYNQEARDILLCFMHTYFPDNEHLVHPKYPLKFEQDIMRFANLFKGLDYKEGYKVLNSKVRNLGENIPPLINTYMNLSPSMKTFGTAINPEFGGVEETGILIKIEDIYPTKKARHMDTFNPN
jgi:hypothetical protein